MLKSQPFAQNVADAINDLKNVIAHNGGYTVYGIHINSNESDPSASVTYLRDAIGMTPAKMNFPNGKFNYGSWRNAFFMPKPCMLKSDGKVAYYLNPDDYSLKEDGTPSDVSNVAFDGNAMIEWGQNGKIWWKIVADENDPTSYSFYVADHKADEGYNCYNHYNKNNIAMEHFYTPAFSGSLDENSKLRSLAGQAIMHDKNATQEISYAKANGDSWNIECYADRLLVTMLCYLMGKSLDLQTTFGRGHDLGGSSAASLVNTGTLADKGMFWGSNNGTDKVKVFGMEDVWAEQFKRINGLLLDNNAYKYKLTEGTADGSTATEYLTTASTGYLEAGTAPAGTYVSRFRAVGGNVIVPDTTGGGSSTYYCDYFWVNASGVRMLLLGGASSGGAGCGFYLSLNIAASAAGWSIGASLSCKPLVG